MELQLTPEPEIVTQHAVPFVFLEKVGPFHQTAPAAWQQFWTLAGNLFRREQIAAMMALSHVDQKKTGDSAYVYQAGVALRTPAPVLPVSDLQSRQLAGGKYARFVLRGSYAQLPHVYPAAFAILQKKNIVLRDDFCIESYLNTPQDTTEDKLQTEILIPIC